MSMTAKEIQNTLAEKGVYLQHQTLLRLTERVKENWEQHHSMSEMFKLLDEAAIKYAKNTDPSKAAYVVNNKRDQLKRPVLKLDKATGEVIAEYDSVYAAVHAAGLDERFSKNIKDCANGKRKSVYGYKYAWLQPL